MSICQCVYFQCVHVSLGICCVYVSVCGVFTFCAFMSTCVCVFVRVNEPNV